MMGVSGGVGAFAPKGPSGAASSTMPAVLNTKGMQSILSGLGVNTVAKAVKKEGLQLEAHINELRVVELNNDQQQAIQQLVGTGALQAAMLLASEDEMTLIKRRLNEIKESVIDPEMMSRLCDTLGISMTGDTLGLKDQEGGVCVIQTALGEIENFDTH